MYCKECGKLKILDKYYNEICIQCDGFSKLDNLCDYCLNNFANCKAKKIEFGNGIGNDNVIKCDNFKNEG